MDLDPIVSLDGDVAALSNRWTECRKLKFGVKCWTPWLKEVGHTNLCGPWRWFPQVHLANHPKRQQFGSVLCCSFFIGAQLIEFGKVELESVVPNSYPETFINVRGQLTRKRTFCWNGSD